MDELIAGESAFLSLSTAALLLARDLAYANRMDEINEVDQWMEDEDGSFVYSDAFEETARTYIHNIEQQLLAAVRSRDLESHGYKKTEDLLGKIKETPPHKIYLDPWVLTQWLEEERGHEFSDYWADKVLERCMEIMFEVEDTFSAIRYMGDGCLRKGGDVSAIIKKSS